MQSFIQTCLENGYENTKNINPSNLSAMSNIDLILTHKENKRKICWGLSEKGKPPTLIYPRPNIQIKRNNSYTINHSDDYMNIVLQTTPHEKILEAMFDNKIIIKIESE